MKSRRHVEEERFHIYFVTFYKEKHGWALDLKNKLKKVDEFKDYSSDLFSYIFLYLFNLDTYKKLLDDYIELLDKLNIKNAYKIFSKTPPKSDYVYFDYKFINLILRILYSEDCNKLGNTDHPRTYGLCEKELDEYLKKLENFGVHFKSEITKEIQLLNNLSLKNGCYIKPMPRSETDSFNEPKVINTINSSDFIDFNSKSNLYENQKQHKKNMFMCCFFCIRCCRSKDNRKGSESDQKVKTSDPTLISFDRMTSNSEPVTQEYQVFDEETGFIFKDFYNNKIDFADKIIVKVSKIASEIFSFLFYKEILQVIDSVNLYKSRLEKIYNLHRFDMMTDDFKRRKNLRTNLYKIKLAVSYFKCIVKKFGLYDDGWVNIRSKLYISPILKEFYYIIEDLVMQDKKNLIDLIEQETLILNKVSFIEKNKPRKLTTVYQTRF